MQMHERLMFQDLHAKSEADGYFHEEQLKLYYSADKE